MRYRAANRPEKRNSSYRQILRYDISASAAGYRRTSYCWRNSARSTESRAQPCSFSVCQDAKSGDLSADINDDRVTRMQRRIGKDAPVYMVARRYKLLHARRKAGRRQGPTTEVAARRRDELIAGDGAGTKVFAHDNRTGVVPWPVVVTVIRNLHTPLSVQVIIFLSIERPGPFGFVQRPLTATCPSGQHGIPIAWGRYTGLHIGCPHLPSGVICSGGQDTGTH